MPCFEGIIYQILNLPDIFWEENIEYFLLSHFKEFIKSKVKIKIYFWIAGSRSIPIISQEKFENSQNIPRDPDKVPEN